MSRNVLTYEAAMARIESQFTLQQKLDVADFVIDTSGKIENSINSTKLIISLLKEQLHGRN
jgi:dephospho-CoA kinase